MCVEGGGGGSLNLGPAKLVYHQLCALVRVLPRSSISSTSLNLDRGSGRFLLRHLGEATVATSRTLGCMWIECFMVMDIIIFKYRNSLTRIHPRARPNNYTSLGKVSCTMMLCNPAHSCVFFCEVYLWEINLIIPRAGGSFYTLQNQTKPTQTAPIQSKLDWYWCCSNTVRQMLLLDQF